MTRGVMRSIGFLYHIIQVSPVPPNPANRPQFKAPTPYGPRLTWYLATTTAVVHRQHFHRRDRAQLAQMAYCGTLRSVAVEAWGILEHPAMALPVARNASKDIFPCDVGGLFSKSIGGTHNWDCGFAILNWDDHPKGPWDLIPISLLHIPLTSSSV
ncbi:hypothetical protein A0H81_08723 [Grifola frondosa]|uniref:Uncharacterized protein n=1 Tax=Grifola frondosa TaxID=5627 RepID=A0A1C7M534_GRIFR|nr:hypothetical protein A0H81_08723 [Grifola frondosa]